VFKGVPNGAHEEAKPKRRSRAKKPSGIALVLAELDEVRSVSENVPLSNLEQTPPVRAVIAPYIPSQVVSALASEGIASFQASDTAVSTLGKQKKLGLPKASSWGEETKATAGKSKIQLKWLAVDREQKWTQAGRSTVAKTS
jgi:aconitate hydratase